MFFHLVTLSMATIGVSYPKYQFCHVTGVQPVTSATLSALLHYSEGNAAQCSRYLHQQWDKKASTKKRAGEAGAGPEEGAKKPRLSSVPDTSNTSLAHSAAQQYFLPGLAPGPTHPPPAYPGTSQPVNRFANQQ